MTAPRVPSTNSTPYLLPADLYDDLHGYLRARAEFDARPFEDNKALRLLTRMGECRQNNQNSDHAILQRIYELVGHFAKHPLNPELPQIALLIDIARLSEECLRVKE